MRVRVRAKVRLWVGARVRAKVRRWVGARVRGLLALSLTRYPKVGRAHPTCSASIGCGR